MLVTVDYTHRQISNDHLVLRFTTDVEFEGNRLTESLDKFTHKLIVPIQLALTLTDYQYALTFATFIVPSDCARILQACIANIENVSYA